MEDQVCPRCRTTKYRNPSLKLLVNVCGHSLCESCVELLFLKGSGSCPECQIPLRRNNFRVQLFEDPGVEKEVDIRKRVLRDYNKKEDDFPNLDHYNNYLEEIEEIIFNLVNGLATLETNRKMEQYKKENREIILKNKVKTGRCDAELDELIEEEKRSGDKRKAEAEKEEADSKRRKVRTKEALVDELMFSQGDARAIVRKFASLIDEEVDVEVRGEPPQRAMAFSTGIKFGSSVHPVMLDDGPLFYYMSPKLDYAGPTLPPKTELTSTTYLSYMRAETPEEKAGGFDMSLACLRAVQESVVGLYYSPRQNQVS